MTVCSELAGKHVYDYHFISQMNKLLGFRLKMRIIITIRARNIPNTLTSCHKFLWGGYREG